LSTETKAPPLSEIQLRYLALLKSAINGSIYGNPDLLRPVRPAGVLSPLAGRFLAWRGYTVGRWEAWPEEAYLDGSAERAGVRRLGESMVGLKRLDNVQECVLSIVAEGVPGDLVEAGVWRGGCGILMCALLEMLESDRKVVLADSFQGMPAPNVEEYPNDAGFDLHLDESLAVPLDEVRANFARYGYLDERVEFVPGWFSETMQALSARTWSLVRLDGDLYESTMVPLRNLYPNLSPGGYVIIDDYGCYEACRAAVDDYRQQNHIGEAITRIDGSGVYWRKLG
jgi:O-methyltransferase